MDKIIWAQAVWIICDNIGFDLKRIKSIWHPTKSSFGCKSADKWFDSCILSIEDGKMPDFQRDAD